MAGFEIRELNFENKGEVEEAAKVYAAAFAKSPWNEKWTIPAVVKKLRSWKNSADQHEGKILVARNQDSHIVGIAVGQLNTTNEHPAELVEKLGPGKHYFFQELAVHPSHTRKGIATALTEAKLSHARQLNCSYIFAGTQSGNAPLIANLRKFGFEEFHNETVTVGKRDVNWVFYRKRL